MRMLAALALSVVACRGGDRVVEPSSSGPRPADIVVVPASHKIPPGHLADVRKLFEAQVITFPISVTSSAGTQTQFVNPKPTIIGDRFLLAATPEIHAQLDTLLADIAKQPPTPPPATYQLTYWAIDATPSASTTIAPDLAELEPVLKSLAPLGPRTFKTIDRVATRSIDGTGADLKSRRLEIEQTLSADNAALELSLDLKLNGAHPDGPPRAEKISAKFPVTLDKPVVLGQSGDADGSDSADLVLYVVRAQRAE